MQVRLMESLKKLKMIAKIVKGKTFGGCVRYVLNKDKAELLELSNIHPTDEKQMISDFELQSLLNQKVMNKVGISLLILRFKMWS